MDSYTICREHSGKPHIFGAPGVHGQRTPWHVKRWTLPSLSWKLVEGSSLSWRMTCAPEKKVKPPSRRWQWLQMSHRPICLVKSASGLDRGSAAMGGSSWSWVISISALKLPLIIVKPGGVTSRTAPILRSSSPDAGGAT